jgi:hypothetical protein
VAIAMPLRALPSLNSTLKASHRVHQQNDIRKILGFQIQKKSTCLTIMSKLCVLFNVCALTSHRLCTSGLGALQNMFLDLWIGTTLAWVTSLHYIKIFKFSHVRNWTTQVPLLQVEECIDNIESIPTLWKDGGI